MYPRAAVSDEIVRKSPAQSQGCQIMICYLHGQIHPSESWGVLTAWGNYLAECVGEEPETPNCGRTSLLPHQWRKKNIHLASFLLWLMLDQNVKFRSVNSSHICFCGCFCCIVCLGKAFWRTSFKCPHLGTAAVWEFIKKEMWWWLL